MDRRTADLVKSYFYEVDHNVDILVQLAYRHDIFISESTLKDYLRSMKLRRRPTDDDLENVADFIQRQIDLHQGSLGHGYRWMWTKCRVHGYIITKTKVRHLLKILDPVGVERRRRHSLHRREYWGKGPNYLWHMDSYDKLKPYGLCINGAIDGYSRKIIWLKVFRTNSDPRIIATYYLNSVTDIGATPCRIRADMGNENAYVAVFQTLIQNGVLQGTPFMYGTSQHNQRIESWWSIYRKESSSTWMDFLRGLKENGHFSGDDLDVALVQYCFMPILKVCVRTCNNGAINTAHVNRK